VTGVDFDKPLSAWSKAEIVSFSWQIHRLTDAALAARDEGASDKIVQRCRSRRPSGRFRRRMAGRCFQEGRWTTTSHSEGLDFNRSNLSTTDINTAINALMDAAALVEQREERRTYLGASGIGSECLRRVQYDWQCDSVHAARTKRIFSRGHMFEEITVKALGQAGFRMERGTAATHFSAPEDLFKGHADGIIVAGPEC
jgi:hypothetical protein